MSFDFKILISPDDDEFSRKLQEYGLNARRAGMINVVTGVESQAIKDAPVRTANLARSGTSTVNADASVGTVGFTAPYAGYVHEGTGIYGPHKTKIVPKNKTALYWQGAKHPMRSVRGMKPQPFLGNAARKTDLKRLYSEGADQYQALRGGI